MKKTKTKKKTETILFIIKTNSTNIIWIWLNFLKKKYYYYYFLLYFGFFVLFFWLARMTFTDCGFSSICFFYCCCCWVNHNFVKLNDTKPSTFSMMKLKRKILYMLFLIPRGVFVYLFYLLWIFFSTIYCRLSLQAFEIKIKLNSLVIVYK